MASGLIDCATASRPLSEKKTKKKKHKDVFTQVTQVLSVIVLSDGLID
jgi:hypothetical protein